jgi:hypothetical protein
MEAKKKRHIKPGLEYDTLFPRSENDNKTIRRNANVYHTVSFIPKVVQETLAQTKAIAQKLKANSTYDTCKNIWHFVYQHINYKKDEEGYEQIRSPARAWHDRQQGVDCDCYSVFISSVLTNLGIPHILRITKYHRDYFQHIYPVVPNGSKHITIDCVTDKFDYEVPYSEKKDYPMDLQYLNGFDGDGMEELGKLIKKNIAKNKGISPVKTAMTTKLSKKAMKKAAKSNPATPAPAGSSVPAPKKKKGILKKVLNVVNKVNPATVLLRNGVLAAMKLNIKNVAKRLRWSYLPQEQAVAKGIDPAKFQKLVTTRQKLENIFYGAGGKPDNLRKAILGGKGNKDKAVSGLGILPMMDAAYMNEHISLEQLLGPEIYYSENVEGMNGFRGFGELGEPITLATVGAAMGVIAGIVAALKQIGDVFKNKEKGSEDFDEEKTDAPENNVNVPANSSTTAIPNIATNPIIPVTDDDVTSQSFNPASTSEASSMNTNNAMVKTAEEFSPASLNREVVTTDENTEEKSTSTNTNSTNKNTDNNTPPDKQGFWDKNKKWLKPVAIGLGGLTIIAIGYKLSQGPKIQNKPSPKQHSLSGTPHKRKKKNHYRKSNPHNKKAVALL